jgi:hypothetical protein
LLTYRLCRCRLQLDRENSDSVGDPRTPMRWLQLLGLKVKIKVLVMLQAGGWKLTSEKQQNLELPLEISQ